MFLFFTILSYHYSVKFKLVEDIQSSVYIFWSTALVNTGLGGRRFDPDKVILKTLKMVVIAFLLGAQGCGVSVTIDWLVSG